MSVVERLSRLIFDLERAAEDATALLPGRLCRKELERFQDNWTGVNGLIYQAKLARRIAIDTANAEQKRRAEWFKKTEARS